MLRNSPLRPAETRLFLPIIARRAALRTAVMLVAAGLGLVPAAAAEAPAALQPKAHAGAVETTCAALRALIDTWRESRPGTAALRLTGEVVKVERQGPLAFTYVCAEPDAVLVCFQYAQTELAVGDRVIVDGVVAGTWDKGPVLDPCGTHRLE